MAGAEGASPLAKRRRLEEDLGGDPEYFGLYSSIEIHRDMLEDRVRTEAYEQALQQNTRAIAGKVVLDIGMGTGILSFLAARAGARQVYGVEACRVMTEQVTKLIERNQLESQVRILPGLMEEVQVPEQVDVIVSEWMGYMLLYESMLDSVIFARDRYLKPGGKILPSHCHMYIAPYCDMDAEENEEDDLGFWDSVYGFDFSPIKPFVRECLSREPEIAVIPPHFIMAKEAKCIKAIDCLTVTVAELEVRQDFEFTSLITERLSGFAIWFDVDFTTDIPSHSIRLPTGPDHPPTHWCQILLKWTNPPNVCQDGLIQGHIHIRKSPHQPRALAITVSISSPVEMTKEFLFE